MAKDKGGHGSEKRGGGGLSKEATDATRRTFTQKYGATGGTMASRGMPGWAAPGAAAKANNATWRSAPPSQIERLFSGGGQPVASNAHAAATLAGGPKSAPVEAHPAMGLPKGVTMVNMGDPGAMHNTIAKAVGEPTNPRYNRGAVQNAIDSSNRSGRKIGGREASLIHRLLSGGH